MSDQPSGDATGKVTTCEACGAEFPCEPMGKCWCFSETVPAAALDEIKERYQRCLCPDCLKKESGATTA